MMREIHFDSIDSTQAYAKQHAAEFSKAEITCITADEQTAGRGRFQHTWVSPANVNLYITFYFRLPSDTPHLTCLAGLLALSAAQVLKNEGLDPKIKWPNDIQLEGKKLSGILCETSFIGSEVDLFLGIGLNVNMEEKDLANIGQPATSLKAKTGKIWDRKSLLRKLQTQFVQDLDIFRKKGYTPFRELFEKILAYKGQTVRCFDGQREWTGICHSLSEDGYLNLLLPDQTIHTLLSGEIHLRPY